MQLTLLSGLSLGLSLASSVVAHATAWHPSMWGFNFSAPGNFPRDPLQQRVFAGDNGWWFHGHLDHPPNKGDFLEFPAGGETFVEITCDKGASSYYTSNPGGDIRSGNDVCPGSTSLEYHATGIDDVKGCAFGITYTPSTQVNSIQPEDFVIFTVNQTCVWERFTKFEIPADMPACPEGGCTCAWFWVHSADAGSEQIYMNGYQCNITNAKSTVPLAQPQVPRRCGADNDPELVKPADPQNCTYGAKQPIYWLQQERNNLFENSHGPPFYNDLYGFKDGAQNDIFVNSKLPEMNWAGAPVTGQLKAVAGIFAGGSSPAAPAPPAAQSPNSGDSNSSSSQNAAPSPTATQATTKPDTPAATSEPAPSASATQKAPSNVSSTSNSPGKKTCKKKSSGNQKRSVFDSLTRHRRQSVRRHTKH